MELDVMVWSQLPFEMVEHVLSSLPVPVLCRYRTVCKAWNRLIRSRGFGVRNRAAVKRGAPSFLAMRCQLGEEEAWSFLDLDERRWYTVEDKYPGVWRAFMPGDSFLAMDGGLVCRHVDPSYVVNLNNDEHRAHYSIIVFNPIAKAARGLPRVPGHMRSSNLAVLTLAVDDTPQLRFKVFLMGHLLLPVSSAGSLEAQTDDPWMRIYDSNTNEWHGSTNPTWISSPGVKSVSSTVVFQGFLYAVIGISGSRNEFNYDEIWRYSIGRDVWEKVNYVNMGATTFFKTQLFVSSNRLFAIRWVRDLSRRNEAEQWRLDVSEIDIPGVVPERVVDMSQAEAAALFDARRTAFGIPLIAASGFGNSILLICTSFQPLMVLDLETRLWNRLPANPKCTRHGVPRRGIVVNLESDLESEDSFSYPVSHMNLILPSSLEW